MNKTYQVRGYWHSNGKTFQATFAESKAPSKDIIYVMNRQELLNFLNSHKYGWTYYDPDTYKKSFTITQVAKDYDE